MDMEGSYRRCRAKTGVSMVGDIDYKVIPLEGISVRSRGCLECSNNTFIWAHTNGYYPGSPIQKWLECDKCGNIQLEVIECS